MESSKEKILSTLILNLGGVLSRKIMRYRTECAAPLAVIHQSHKRALKKGTRVEKVTHYWGRRYIPVQSNICNVKFDLGPTQDGVFSQ